MKLEGIIKAVEKELPTILTIGSMIGVGITSYFTYKATKKVEKIQNEKKIEYVKAVLPAVISGGLTIAGIFSINKIHLSRYAALASMYAFSKNEDKVFKAATEKIVGKEKKDEIDKEKIVFMDQKQKVKIYDKVTGIAFEACLKDVYDAVLEVNEIVQNEGEATVNDFYRLLNVKQPIIGDDIQWRERTSCDRLDIVWDSDLSRIMEPILTIEYNYATPYTD